MLIEQAIHIMKKHVVDILCNNGPSIYLYGSVTLNDFKLGWSDIDLLCLTKKPITSEQAKHLLNLRQELEKDFSGKKYFRSFEGGMLTLNAFINNLPDRVVYWGSSGQRITDKYYFDSFCVAELIDYGVLLYGDDIRNQLQYPTAEQLKNNIIHHLKEIRNHAVNTERSIYSAGWLLDIARGLYTLKTGRIIAKTTAGEWALENDLCPDADILKKTVEIRKEPEKYKRDEFVLNWAETLGIYIQRFADVLERKLNVAQ